MNDSNQKPHKIYQIHRENQRERILEAAEMLFIRNGIDNVTIGGIAAAARLSRVTLYEYFPNKQEVAWAIFQKISGEMLADSAARLAEAEGSGFQRVEYLLLGGMRLLEKHLQHLRFIVEFNTLYAREGNPARVRSTVEQAGTQAQGYGLFTELIRQGIVDGSIRPELDPNLLSAAMMNLLNALNSRFALLGDLIEEEYDQPVMAMYREICRAFLRGIQTRPPQQEIHH